MTTENPRAWDVLFVGNNYMVTDAAQSRAELTAMVKSLPCVTAVFGRGYPEGIAAGESLYDFKKTGDLYRNARIGIADNQFIEADGFFSDRAFMMLASGGCLMMHQTVQRMEELTGLKDGVHYVEWKNLADLKAKIAYYLEHEDERKRIADAGTLECRTNHTFTKRVEELKGLLNKIPKKKPTITAMMIVKNEIQNIHAAISELSWADNIVVVDTGSNDGTLEYFTHRKEFLPAIHAEGGMILDPGLVGVVGNICLYHFTWTDSFSEARNFAKSKCMDEWVFWMDADDRLPEKTKARLLNFDTWSFRSLGITNPGAFKMRVVDYRNGEAGQSGLQTRLFKNIESIEWRRHVQETVDESIAAIGVVTVAMSKVEVHHQGCEDLALLEAKQKRNLALLAKEPASPWREYQRAVSYAAMERWGDAIIWCNVAGFSSLDKEFKDHLAFMKGYCYYKMGIVYEAKSYFSSSDFPDALYMNAEIEDEAKNFQPELYRKFLKAKPPTLFPSYMEIWKPTARAKLLAWHDAEMKTLAA